MKETRGHMKVLMIRHEEHRHNILTSAGVDRARRRGAALFAKGLIPEVAAGSPATRAVATLLATLEGAVLMPAELLPLDPRLGDVMMGPDSISREEHDRVKAAAQRMGRTFDDYFIREQQFSSQVDAIGRRGFYALRDLLSTHLGKLIAIGSHGPRIDATVRILMGCPTYHLGLKLGQIAAIEFDFGENKEEGKYCRLAADVHPLCLIPEDEG